MSEDGGNRPPFRVSHVIFDIDGTLIDVAGAYEAGFAAAAAHAAKVTGRPIPLSDLRDAHRTASRALRAEGRTAREARIEGIPRAFAAVGCTPDQVDAVMTAMNGARDASLQPYADVEATLSALAERGLVLVAASNGDGEMAHHEVFRYFDAIWLAAVEGVAKPDPRFFLGALERVGATPEAALMVGDRLDNDYTPARAVGMAAVLIDREGHVEDGAVMRVGALTELLELVERV